MAGRRAAWSSPVKRSRFWYPTDGLCTDELKKSWLLNGSNNIANDVIVAHKNGWNVGKVTVTWALQKSIEHNDVKSQKQLLQFILSNGIQLDSRGIAMLLKIPTSASTVIDLASHSLSTGYTISVSDLCQSLLHTKTVKDDIKYRKMIWDEFILRCLGNLCARDFFVRMEICETSLELKEVYRQFESQGFAVTFDLFESVIKGSLSSNCFDVFSAITQSHQKVFQNFNSKELFIIFSLLRSLNSLSVLRSIWNLFPLGKIPFNCYIILLSASNNDNSREAVNIAVHTFNAACQLIEGKRNPVLWKAIIRCCSTHGDNVKARWYAKQAVDKNILTLPM